MKNVRNFGFIATLLVTFLMLVGTNASAQSQGMIRKVLNSANYTGRGEDNLLTTNPYPFRSRGHIKAVIKCKECKFGDYRNDGNGSLKFVVNLVSVNKSVRKIYAVTVHGMEIFSAPEDELLFQATISMTLPDNIPNLVTGENRYLEVWWDKVQVGTSYQIPNNLWTIGTTTLGPICSERGVYAAWIVFYRKTPTSPRVYFYVDFADGINYMNKYMAAAGYNLALNEVKAVVYFPSTLPATPIKMLVDGSTVVVPRNPDGDTLPGGPANFQIPAAATFLEEDVAVGGGVQNLRVISERRLDFIDFSNPVTTIQGTPFWKTTLSNNAGKKMTMFVEGEATVFEQVTTELQKQGGAFINTTFTYVQGSTMRYLQKMAAANAITVLFNRTDPSVDDPGNTGFTVVPFTVNSTGLETAMKRGFSANGNNIVVMFVADCVNSNCQTVSGKIAIMPYAFANPMNKVFFGINGNVN